MARTNTVQASTVASESAFSISGRIISERRSRLTPESVELQPTGLAQLATKGVLGEVVTTCERSQVRVFRWESVGFCPIDASIRGWQGLSPGNGTVIGGRL
ncbi:putative transcription elongation factor SPT5-like protein 1 [Tanacetum coccineum]